MSVKTTISSKNDSVSFGISGKRQAENFNLLSGENKK
jgi:hypothetical protein